MAQDILIVDDEKDIRDLVFGILEDEGYQPRAASDGTTALEAIKQRQPNLVILDIWLGDSDRDGLKILEIIKRDHPFVPVIMISGHATIETAVAAIKKGAYDFIEKPFQTERLLVVVERALESAQLKRENADLKLRAGLAIELMGTSVAIQHLRQATEKSAVGNSRIVIVGPSGTGKETIARQLHSYSKRVDGPFVSLNCASIHPDWIEAELFGTDISQQDETTPRKIGLIEKAHNGTLFLDEITELPLPIQFKFLKFLQEKTFMRMGGSTPISVDVRVISASSVDLKDAIQNGHLREDLYYRLNTVQINMPSLKERSADIPLLAEQYMQQAAYLHNGTPRKFSADAIAVLQSYDWPGNLRQLKNVMEWAFIMAPGDYKEPIRGSLLPPELLGNLPSSGRTAEIVIMPLKEAREAFERDYLVAQVNRFGGNISQTARFIGMERSALHRKLRALGVHDPKTTPESEPAIEHA